MLKRVVSLMLTAVMLLSLLPLPVRAEESALGEPVLEEVPAPTAAEETTMPTEETLPEEETAPPAQTLPETDSATEPTADCTVPAGEETVPPETEAVETEPAVEETEEVITEETVEATEETIPQDAYLGSAPEQFDVVIHNNSMQTVQPGETYRSGSVSGDLNARPHTKGQIQQMYYQVSYPSKIFDESPSVKSPYRAGKLSNSMLQSGITTLNYVRYAANLPLIQLSSAMNEDAQHGAVVNAANNSLSHRPSRPSGMDDAFYEWGYFANSHSNIAYMYGYPDKAALQLSVLMFMDDDDAGNNDRVGHRRWLLNPEMVNVGFGYAKASSGANYVSAEVFDCYSGEYVTRSDVDYEYIAWPASGNFPSNLFGKSIPWSISLNPAIYQTPSAREVRVTLTRQSDGRVWQLNSNSGSHTSPSGPYLVVDTGYYSIPNCIIFHPKSSTIGSYEGVFSVDITGLYTVDGTPASVHYEVDFFDVDSYEAPPEPIDGGICGESLSWDYYPNGELVISGQGVMTDFETAPWQQYASEICKVTMENGVTAIGANAFAGCTGLTKLSIPNAVQTIGSGAFRGCTGLTELTLPNMLTALGNGVFADSGLNQLCFTGSFPELTETSLTGLDALVFYPGTDGSWKTAALDDRYGGNPRWIAAFESRYVYEITPSAAEITAGQTVTLKALMAPGDEASGIIQWELKDEDTEKATLTGSGTSAKLKTADLTENTTITVTASMEQGNLPVASMTLQIRPKAQVVQIFREDREVTGQTILVDLNREGQSGEFQLTAGILPEEAPQNITWKSKNTSVAKVNEEGLVTLQNAEGTAVITATAADGSKKSASVTIRAERLVQTVKIEGKAELVGGQTQTLTAKNAQTDESLESGQVTWNLAEEDAPYASISTKGKLTTKSVAEKTEITVFCTVAGTEEATARFPVVLHPQTTLVKIGEADADGTVTVPDNQTVWYDLNDGSVSLAAVCYPEDGINLPVKWTVSDAKKQAYAAYSIDPQTNVLTIHSPTEKIGKITVKAAAQDGSKKSASVTVRFGRFAKSVQITTQEETLTSGSELKLQAVISPGNVTENSVVWRLEDSADKAYVSLSSKGVLKAKTVYGEKTVTVVAVSKDGRASWEKPIRILPEDTGMLVLHDASSQNVTKSELHVDRNKTSEIVLTAHDYADGQRTEAAWKSSKTSIATVKDGVVTFIKDGTVTITATAADKRKASVTVKASKLAQKVEITSADHFEVASGKSITLKASLENASSNKVTWSIVSGSAWAKINTKGKLTAEKNIVSAKPVVVRATAADGSGKKLEKTVTVRPLSTAVQIYSRDEATGAMLLNVDSREMQENLLGIVRTNTTFVWDMEKKPELKLSAKVYPYSENDENRRSVQGVKWSSSSQKVASVAPDGTITCNRAGTTTITATAADGSGRKAAFKLTVVKKMTSLKLPEGGYIAGGKKLTLQPTISPADTTNKKLTWKVTGGNGAGYAWMSGNGVLNTRKVTAPKTVEVTAWAQDGSGCVGKCTVTIYPATTKIQLWSGGENVTGKTLTAEPGTSLSLSATCRPSAAAGKYTWKSSNSWYASVDQNGNVTLGDAVGKTVTITATASDNSGKKASVKFKIIPAE